MPATTSTRTLFIILSAALFASFTACQSSDRITMDDLDLSTSSPPGDHVYYTSTRQKTISQIVNEISANKTVDASAVSIDSHQSLQYKQFLLLKDFATENELIELTQHKSGNVKAYAFEALCDRDSKQCKKIFEQHLSDKTIIREFSGCMQSEKYINLFYFQLLEEKLNRKEIAFYKKKLAASFTPEEWESAKQMALLSGSWPAENFQHWISTIK